MKVLALIPHYNHEQTVFYVASYMQKIGIDCLIVDDGSCAESKKVLQEFENKDGITIIYHKENKGKGAAVKTGTEYAFNHGYTHILQVDADAQHCLDDTENIINEAKRFPNQIICADPIYGDDAPKSRKYGRKITNFWLVINTLSFDIKDGMCGFRIYPAEILQKVFLNDTVGDRMEFDIEVLVRLHRRGYLFRWLPTPVRYGDNGISHFKMWKDNWMISKMHARLFFDMLLHCPQIIKVRINKHEIK